MPHPELPDEYTANFAADRWNIEGAIPSEVVRDVAYGEGWHYVIGADGQTAFELFPEARVARLSSAHSKIELHRIEPPTVREDMLLFSAQHDDERIELDLSPTTGAIFLQITPNSALETRESSGLLPDRETGVEDHVGNQTPEHEPSAPLSSDAEIPSTAIDERAATPDAEKQEGDEVEPARLTITGRLGRPPSFRETPNGTLIARLPVAVHEEDGSTTWHTVLAFRERAQKLRDQGLDTGMHVEIVGYPHQREIKRRDGSSRTVEELYAAVIRTPKPDEPVT